MQLLGGHGWGLGYFDLGFFHHERIMREDSRSRNCDIAPHARHCAVLAAGRERRAERDWDVALINDLPLQAVMASDKNSGKFKRDRPDIGICSLTPCPLCLCGESSSSARCSSRAGN